MRLNMMKYGTAVTIAALLSLSTALTGCGNQTAANPQETVPPVETQTVPANDNANQKPPASANHTNDSNVISSGNNTNKGVVQAPADIRSKKVLKTISLQNGYSKKVERLVDGGERITILDSSGKVTAMYAEYDGFIVNVNDRVVTVNVEHGGEMTITIPKDAYIDDDEGLGLRAGLEMEWTVNDKGLIEKVDLED